MIYIIKGTKPALLTFSDKLIDKQLLKRAIISHWSYVDMEDLGVQQPVWVTGDWS